MFPSANQIARKVYKEEELELFCYEIYLCYLSDENQADNIAFNYTSRYLNDLVYIYIYRSDLLMAHYTLRKHAYSNI